MLNTENGYEAYEVKYHKNPMTKEECLKEIEDIKGISDFNAIKYGFVSSSGFDFISNDFKLISGATL